MSDQSSKVSVIIPTYNQAELLQNALISVINQTMQDWEAIVIDNNSRDNTREVVEAFNDPRIRYVPFSNKGIIAASRNHGIHLAAGEYIAFLDSDDLWYASKLATCRDHLGPDTDIVCHGLRIRREAGLKESLIPHLPGHDIYHFLLDNGNASIATSAVMLKKEYLSQFGVFSEKPEMVTAEDYELWLRLSKKGIRWGCIKEELGEYRIHGGNASGNIKRQMLAEEAAVMMHFNEDYPSSAAGTRLKMKRRRVMIALRAGKRALDSGFFKDALNYSLQGITKIWT